eukprot:5431010-Pleurochrysis_carterae.AAC.1
MAHCSVPSARRSLLMLIWLPLMKERRGVRRNLSARHTHSHELPELHKRVRIYGRAKHVQAALALAPFPSIAKAQTSVPHARVAQVTTERTSPRRSRLLSHPHCSLARALEEPLDTRAAFAILMRLVEERVETALSEQGGELRRMAETLGEYDLLLKRVRAQVLEENAAAELALAQRDAHIAQLRAAQAQQTVQHAI